MKKSLLWMSFISVLLLLGACGTTESDTTESDTNSAEETTNSGSEDTAAEESSNNEEEISSESETEGSDSEPAADSEAGESESGQQSASEDAATEQSAAESVTEEVTLYFADEQLMEVYRVQKTVTAPTEADLPIAALQAWLEGPSADGLYSLTPENTEVSSVTEENGTAIVTFSPALLEANLGSSGELFLTEQIAMIMQQFGYGQTKIEIKGETPESLFGHIDASKPIEAGSPEDYKEYGTN